jgi:hypothetical protein
MIYFFVTLHKSSLPGQCVVVGTLVLLWTSPQIRLLENVFWATVKYKFDHLYFCSEEDDEDSPREEVSEEAL